MLIIRTTAWQSEVMNLCSITTSKYPHNLMNRCIRDPYVQWCERRTSSLTSGEAVYSIGRCCFLPGITKQSSKYESFCKCSIYEVIHTAHQGQKRRSYFLRPIS